MGLMEWSWLVNAERFVLCSPSVLPFFSTKFPGVYRGRLDLGDPYGGPGPTPSRLKEIVIFHGLDARDLGCHNGRFNRDDTVCGRTMDLSNVDDLGPSPDNWDGSPQTLIRLFVPTLFRGTVSPEGRKGRIWVQSVEMKAKMEKAKAGVEGRWRSEGKGGLASATARLEVLVVQNVGPSW